MECILVSPKIVDKKWGRELWLHNNKDYCGKILEFYPNAQFSMHFHILKNETFHVIQGDFRLDYINTSNAKKMTIYLNKGDTVDIPRGVPHQLTCGKTHGKVAEFSTEHFDEDSYRVSPGDSQNKLEYY